MGLNDSQFGGLCTTLIGMDPLPTPGEAYYRVIREEHRLTLARSLEHQQDVVGFFAQHATILLGRIDSSPIIRFDTSILKTRDRSMMYSHCQIYGHEKCEYWLISGFPDWWDERSEKQQDRNKASSRVMVVVVRVSLALVGAEDKHQLPTLQAPTPRLFPR